jgi:SAM-dependent methyltransferase
LSAQSHYEEVGRGFDRSAASYDHEIGLNPAMQYMRRISLSILLSTFQPGQRVLEIGCGTGEEAIALAGHGVHVLATDLSPQMVELTRQKAVAAGLAESVHVRCLAAGRLTALRDDWGEGTFDGAYSSLGPLNGEPDLGPVREALTVLLRPGSLLVASVMNRYCAFETLWYFAHGRPRQAIRRWRGKTMVTVSPHLADVVPTWYHTPRSLTRAFAPVFRTCCCRALPFLLPPPFAAPLWREHAHWIQRLVQWEERLAPRWPFYALGDHYLIVLRKAERSTAS